MEKEKVDVVKDFVSRAILCIKVLGWGSFLIISFLPLFLIAFIHTKNTIFVLAWGGVLSLFIGVILYWGYSLSALESILSIDMKSSEEINQSFFNAFYLIFFSVILCLVIMLLYHYLMSGVNFSLFVFIVAIVIFVLLFVYSHLLIKRKRTDINKH